MSTKKYTMYNPSHPGLLVKELLEGKNLTITKFAKLTGISRENISEIINGHFGISIQSAIIFAKFFGTNINFWVDSQTSYDIFQTKKRFEESGRLDNIPVYISEIV
jgi:antitoxin HigA-1